MKSRHRPSVQWYRRRAVRTALAAVFVVAGGMGAELATASSANAMPVVHYMGDGWFCQELPSWPYYACYN